MKRPNHRKVSKGGIPGGGADGSWLDSREEFKGKVGPTSGYMPSGPSYPQERKLRVVFMLGGTGDSPVKLKRNLKSRHKSKKLVFRHIKES